MNRLSYLFLFVFILLVSQISAQQDFTRVFSIPTATWEVGGFGGIVAGVDFDGDGKTEIYACNTNFVDRDDELIPRLYKFEWNGSDWEMVWMTDTNIPLQNTWPGFTWGDLDKDGKPEIIWAPTNFLNNSTNPNPPRILIYEYAGDGTDAMGVFDGIGGYLPNAFTTIVDESNTEVRPVKLVIEDIDVDGVDEIIFADRRAGTGDYHFGVISVSDVPDFADGTEVWNIEANGIDFPNLDGTGNKWDVAVLNNYIYLWSSASSTVYPVKYQGGMWEALPGQPLVGEGSCKSAQVVDLDNDGTKEIVVGSWFDTNTGGAKVFLHKQVGDTLQTFEIADLKNLGGIWLEGGASGDLDGDGYLDFVFGSEYSDVAVTNNLIFRISYKGGDITDPNNYVATAIDSFLLAEGGNMDVVAIGNLDGDAESEVAYTQGYSDGNMTDMPSDVAILDINWTDPTSVEKESANIPENFYLKQNYPNPFNPSTVINFGITEATAVDLRVYDVLGREVAILVNNQNLEAGSYNATFNAEGLSSGIYVYRITAGNNTTSMKLELLK